MLYHKEIGFPDTIEWELEEFELIFSSHAQREALQDRFVDVITLPDYVDLLTADIIEIETKDNVHVLKYVARISYDKQNDIVIVFIPLPEHKGRVKTVWANNKQDKHRTLDRSKYNKPPEK